MKLKYIFPLFPFLLALAVSCSAPIHTITTVPARDIDSTDRPGLIYYLPQSVLRIRINILRVSTVPGPYHAFADKYLGIKGVPHDRSAEWLLSDMNITVVEEPDPEQFYLITSGDSPVDESMLDPLRSKGIIFYNHREMPFISDYYETMDALLQNKVPYTDLSIKDNLIFETDTIYKTILTDSSFVRVPVYKKEVISKTLEERAREASDFLIKIRKRRFRLLAGMDEFYPSGEAIRFGVGELDKLEGEYVSLFAGKTFTDTIRLNFIYVPAEGKSSELIKLFEFSGTGGINARTGMDRIVSLMLKKTGKTSHLENYSRQLAGLSTNVVYYRIPDIAELEIQIDGIPLLRDRVPVYQYGTVVALPVE